MHTVSHDNYFAENGKYLFAALLLHVAIVVALTISFRFTQSTIAPIQSAIKAVVIDNSAQRIRREKEQAEKERIAREQAQAEEAAREQAEAEKKREQELQREATRQEEERQRVAADQKRKIEEKKADEKRAADKLAAARKQAEEKRVADIKAKQAEKQKAEREAREQAEREAELKRSMAEENQLEAQSAGVLADYYAQIKAKIDSNWSRPPTAKLGISCELTITQAPGGAVLSVRIGACNGDQAVRESIETAVNKSSPLPMPSDSRLFKRQLSLRFKPDE